MIIVRDSRLICLICFFLVDNRGSKGSDGGGNDVEYGSRECVVFVWRRLGGWLLGR